MIKVNIGNNVKREFFILDENTPLRMAIEKAGVDYQTGLMHLNGSSLTASDLDKTFADFGIDNECYLINVQKAKDGIVQ